MIGVKHACGGVGFFSVSGAIKGEWGRGVGVVGGGGLACVTPSRLRRGIGTGREYWLRRLGRAPHF